MSSTLSHSFLMQAPALQGGTRAPGAGDKRGGGSGSQGCSACAALGHLSETSLGVGFPVQSKTKCWHEPSGIQMLLLNFFL